MLLSRQPIPEVFTWNESPLQIKIVTNHVKKVAGFLCGERQAEIVSQDERISELLRLIQEEVKQESKILGYNYCDLVEYDLDYQKRLGISDELFEEVLKKRVLVWKLWEYYYELLSLGDPIIMKQKLLTECWIDDLVYEALVKFEYLQNSIVECMWKDEFEIRLKNNNWGDLNRVKYIWLDNIDMIQLWKEKLYAIFSNSRQAKRISLSRVNLWNTWIEKLRKIFKHFIWVRWIWLMKNDLWNLREDELEVISLNISWVKYINLQLNNLENLSTDELSTFFKNLKLVKFIDVRNNNFSKEQRKFIEDLLPNTKIIFY